MIKQKETHMLKYYGGSFQMFSSNQAIADLCSYSVVYVSNFLSDFSHMIITDKHMYLLRPTDKKNRFVVRTRRTVSLIRTHSMQSTILITKTACSNQTLMSEY